MKVKKLKRVIFNSARDGDLHRLKAILENKHEDEVSLLVSARRNGYTPLLVACRNGHMHVVFYLIEKCRADVEQTGTVTFGDGKKEDGASPLWFAAALGRLYLVKYLLRHKASVNCASKTDSTTPLLEASSDGRLDIVKCLVEHGADIEIADNYGETCLMHACIMGHYEVSKYLVDHGADVNRISDERRIQAVHECAQQGNLDIMKLLLQNGATINSRMEDNKTPLMIACFHGNYEISKYLVECGADINGERDNYGRTALHECAESGHLDIMKLLLQNGATINSRSEDNKTPLMEACFHGHYEISKYLVECGADINGERDNYGRTALHECAESCHLDIMKLLLRNGATLIADSEGRTPLVGAALVGHTAIVEYFQQEYNLKRQDKINALEILGATFVDSKQDMNLALDIWRRVMKLRQDFPTENILSQTPIAACMDATEVRTLSQLEDLRWDPDGMRRQALLVRERILGPDNLDNLHYIIQRGATHAEAGDFNRTKQLWMYAVDSMPNDPSEAARAILENLEKSYRKSSPISRGYMVVYFRVLLHAFERALKEIERIRIKNDLEKSYDDCDDSLYNALYALNLMIELQPRMTQSEESELKKAAYQLVRTNPITMYDGWTALHNAISFEEVYLPPPDMYNPLEVVNLLLEVGASPDALDNDRNTPLHRAAMNKSCPQLLFDTLLNHGAHLDLCNREQKTPLQLLSAADLRFNIYPLRHLSLQCLCAKAVQRHKIPYKGWVHKELEVFLDSH